MHLSVDVSFDAVSDMISIAALSFGNEDMIQQVERRVRSATRAALLFLDLTFLS